MAGGVDQKSHSLLDVEATLHVWKAEERHCLLLVVSSESAARWASSAYLVLGSCPARNSARTAQCCRCRSVYHARSVPLKSSREGQVDFQNALQNQHWMDSESVEIFAKHPSAQKGHSWYACRREFTPDLRGLAR